MTPELSFRRLVVFAVGIVFMAAEAVEGRELRPSDHGLEYQQAQTLPPETKGFFRVVLPPPPRAVYQWTRGSSSPSEDASWWRKVSGQKRKDWKRRVMLFASLACGVVGVVLLASSAVLCLLEKRRKRKVLPPAAPGSNICASSVNITPEYSPAPLVKNWR